MEYQGDFSVGGKVIATSFVTASDERIKENIEDVDTDTCLAMLEAVPAKTYIRTDMPGNRIGFIAQHIEAEIAPEWQNIIRTNNELLARDYSRLAPILWTICKNQEARIKALENIPNV